MAEYKLEEIRELRNQLDFSPERVRTEQLRRAERLIGELDASGTVPYGYVHLFITGHPVESRDPGELLKAGEVRRDLQVLLVELSEGMEVKAEEEGERVYTLREAAGGCRISVKTLGRWRRIGLPVRSFVFPDELKALGITRSALTTFVKKNRRRVSQARSFRRLSDQEYRQVVDAARRLAKEGASQTQIARLLGKQTGRSHETIRQALKRYQQERPEDDAFADLGGRLSDEQKEAVVQRMQEGDSPSRLAKELGVDRSSIYRTFYRKKAAEELDKQITYVWCPDFEKEDAEETFLSVELPLGPEELSFSASSLEEYLQGFRKVPVLSADEERKLFMKYNYAKYCIARLQQALDAKKPSGKLLSEIEGYKEVAVDVKGTLVYSNMRLVMSVARRHVGRFVHMAELVSEGTVALLSAVEKFDFRRGTKFSTYATWVLVRRFARLVPEENYQLDTFLTGRAEQIAGLSASEPSDGWREGIARMLRSVIGRLPDRERRVISSRFGLEPGSQPRSLREIGEKEGLSKERVRQLEAEAFAKLRELLADESLELPPG